MRKTYSLKERLLAFALCAVMVLGMVPAGSVTAVSAEFGSVSPITAGDVSGNETPESVVTVSNVTLDWSPADKAAGRDQDGWWVGIQVTAPDGMTKDSDFDNGESNVTYQIMTGVDTWSASKPFWDAQDSDKSAVDTERYLTMWGMVNADYLESFAQQRRDLNYGWRFDWDMDGEYEQVVKLVIEPENIVLMKDGTQVYPDPNAFTFEKRYPAAITYGDEFANPIVWKEGYGTITYSVDDPAVATVDAYGTLTIKNVGTVTVTAQMEGNSVWAAQETSYVLTVQPKPFELYITSQTKTYGEADPEFTYTTNLENEQNVILGFNPFRASGEAVGQYSISARVTVDPKYSMNMLPGTLAIVKAKQPEFGFAEKPNTLVYESGMTYTNTASGGNGTGEISYAVISGEDVAEVDEKTGILTVKKPGTVTVTATKAADDCYEGAEDSYVLTVTLGDISNQIAFEDADPEDIYYGDSFSNAIAAKPGYGRISYSVDNESVASVDENGALTVFKAGTVTVTAKMAASEYYDATQTSYVLTVQPKPFTLTINSCTKAYGEADPEFTYTTDLENEQDVIQKFSPFRAVGEAVGDYAISAAVTVNANYSMTMVAGTLTIGKAEQTNFAFQDPTPADHVYEKDMTFTNAATGGQGSGDVTYSVNDGSVASVDKNGILSIHKAGTVTVTATKAEDDCYKQAVASYVLTVKTADAQSGFGFEKPDPEAITYGDEFANAIVHKEGYGKIIYSVNDEKTATVDESGALTVKKVGTVTVTAKMEAGDYYGAAEASYTLTIDQKPFDLTVNDSSKVYGEADPAFSYTTDVELPEGTVTLNRFVRSDQREKAGEYKVTAVVTVNPNYKVTVIAGTLTIHRAAQTGFGFQKEEPADLIYQKGLTFTNTASGGQGSGSITYAVTSGMDVASVDENGMLTIHKAGTVTVTAVKEQDDYYQTAEDSYTLTIHTADAQSGFGFENPIPGNIFYGDAFKNAIVAKEGYGKITYSVSDEKIATVDENGVLTVKKVGTVIVTAKMEKGDYYGAAEASYTLTIDQKPFNLTVNDGSKIYGEADPDFGYTTDIELPEGAITLHRYYRHNMSEKAGTYSVTAVVTVNPNYKVTVVAGTLTIERADQTGQGFVFATPNPEAVTYTPNLTVTNKADGGPGTGEVTYSVSDENVASVDENGVLTIKQSGTVTVTAAKAQDDYYNGTTASYTLTVNKADQTGFAFDPISETVTFDKNAAERTIEAKGGQSGKEITYKVIEGADVAAVGETDGRLVIKKAGTVTVEATRAGDERYNPVTNTYTLTVEKATQEFLFESGDAIDLIYGVKEFFNGVRYADYNHNDLALTYTISENTVGASVADDGTVSFASSEGQVGSVTVTVEKPGNDCYLSYKKSYVLTLDYLTIPGDVKCSLSGTQLNESGWYSASPVVIHAPEGYQISYSNDLGENNKWSDAVEHTMEGVNTAEVYLKYSGIPNDSIPDGSITSVIQIADIKLDTTIPQTPVITYGEPLLQKLLEGLTFGFYKAPMQVEVTVEDLYNGTKDAASGIETITLIFEGQKGKYITEEVSITEIQNGEKLTYTMDKEFYGTVSAYAMDIAGHKSLPCNVGISGENGIQTVAADSVAPEVNVAFQTADADTVVKQIADDPAQGKPSREDVAPADANTRYVYSGAFQAVITVKEANFYEDNIVVTVLRDGVAYTKFESTVWEAAEEAAVFRKTITLTEDGDYQLLVEYTDNSGNDMALTSGEYGQKTVKTYTSNIHTVDANGGTFQVEYKTDDAVNGDHYSTERTAVITVTDRNFHPNGVVFQVTSSDLVSGKTNSDTALNTWDAWTAVEGKDHAWQASCTLPGDHRYEITMSGKDIAGNALLCDGAETYTNSLVVDGSCPENLTVEYSTHTADKILENLTFGYYEADKIVTLTATDTVSGIKSFQVQVTPDGSEQATNIVLPENLVITVDNGNTAVLSGEPGFVEVEKESVKTENGTTSVSFKVPAEFRGTIDFTAANMADVSSEKADNRQVLIVDNMAPRRSMTFTPNRVVDALTLKDMAENYAVTEGDEIIMYYTGDAVSTIRVQEENFYPEEVQITVTRDGTAYTGFTASEWMQVTEDGVLDTYEKTVTIPQTDEGDYFITMDYTDKSGNVMESYTSQRIVIDHTAPAITFAYSNNNEISTSNDGRAYYDDVQKVTVTIKDRNFRADDVVVKVNAKDVAGGNVLTMNDDGTFVKAYAEQGVDGQQWTPYVEGTWRSVDDAYELELVFDQDANYDLSVEYTDLATNMVTSETRYFTVDKTVPEITNVEYSRPNVVDEVLKAITFDNYYGDKVTVTVTVKDDTSGIDEIIYSYLKREGSSDVNAGESDIVITEGIEQNGNVFTVKFQVPRVDLTNKTQFDGTVTVTANDRSDNTIRYVGDQRLVVDNISPRSAVAYNAPVTTTNGISYYAGDIEVAVEINEANFDSGDVKVTARKDGEDYPVKVNWTNNSVDRHTGRFILTEDGDYTVSVTYTDKSGNRMQNYTSDQLTLDTTLPVISISNVKANSANKDEIYGFMITVTDTNLNASSLAPRLTAVVKGEDGTYTTQNIELGAAQVVTDGQEYTYTVENLTQDALYTLTCSAEDMSANAADSSLLEDGKTYENIQFSINREGSAFGYGSDYTDSVVSRYFVYSVDEDMVLVEVNADPIENYTVSLNGTELVEGTDYISEQTSNDGEWSKRTYALNKELFAQEGEYNIIVSSVDKAETTAYSDVKNLRTVFVVDQTAPVITITGLEEGGRYQTDEQTVTLIPSDEGGRLNSLKVVVLDSDGNPLVSAETGEDISVRFDLSGEELLDYLDANDGKVTLTVPGGLNNQVQIVCDDCAANSEGKPNTYNETFERVTVSQSGLVIFYANKPAFYGTIGGTAGAASLLIFLLVKKKKKNAEKAKA